MKGSEENFRGPPYSHQADGKMSSRASHTLVSNGNNMTSPNNSRQDNAHRGNAVRAQISAAHGSGSGSTSSPNRPHHHGWHRGRPGEHGGTDDHRLWVSKATPFPSLAEKFIFVSFNILGVENAYEHQQELYRHIPPFILEWNHRKRRILLELRLWSPDIMCLQEVDRFEDLQKDMVQQGYEGIYKGRTGGSSDGCAIFWRTQKFELLREECIEYQEFNLRHNVAQLCVLQTKGGKQKRTGKKTKETVADNRVVVCNIHVLFNPKRGDIKLGQVRHLLEKAYSLSQEWGGIPVLVAGDFNSIPQSPLYQFMRNAVLDVSHYDRQGISGQVENTQRQTCVERWTATSLQIQTNNEGQMLHAESSIVSTHCGVVVEEKPLHFYEWSSEQLKTATGNASESLMRHNLKLQSAYSSIPGSSETRDASHEPLVTTYHRNFMGTVDYIWFTDGLVPLKVLEVLPVHILQRTKGLPSKKWGSDHLALACEFAFSVDE